MNRIAAPHGLYPALPLCRLFLLFFSLPLFLYLLERVRFLNKADAAEVPHIVHLKLPSASRARVTPRQPFTNARVVEGVATSQNNDWSTSLCEIVGAYHAHLTTSSLLRFHGLSLQARD